MSTTRGAKGESRGVGDGWGVGVGVTTVVESVVVGIGVASTDVVSKIEVDVCANTKVPGVLITMADGVGDICIAGRLEDSAKDVNGGLASIVELTSTVVSVKRRVDVGVITNEVVTGALI